MSMKVANGSLKFGATRYQIGDQIPDEYLENKENIQRLVDLGFLCDADASLPEPPPNVITSHYGGVKQGEKAPRASRWNLDPDALQGKTLEELNIMIQERKLKEEIPLMDTAEEALAFLSKDFVPASAEN